MYQKLALIFGVISKGSIRTVLAYKERLEKKPNVRITFP